VDIDEDAIQSARENAEMNGVLEFVEFEVGSLAEIETGKFSVRHAPLVVANILAVVIIRLLDEGLGSLLASDGDLVLSGILEEQVSDVTAALERNGLQLVSQRQQGGWVALLAKAMV
jgi:ribosomal protein L11 methyltransferase